MPARQLDPDMRARLLEAAARLLAEEGPSALSTRKVAAEANTSTMAVYTEFGSMAELVRAVVDEGFARLAARLTALQPTEDPVADLGRIVVAYRTHAHDNPHLYAVMYGTASLGGYRRSGGGLAQGRYTFDVHVEFTRRAIAAGRFRDDDAVAVATKIWTAVHGYIMLELAGYFGQGSDGIRQNLVPMLLDLFVGLGDDRAAATTSAGVWFTDTLPFRVG
ncbi:TetR/AcrR family transcriptional regulator [Nocardia fluminea]|uniref:TetR/AcrR family transcriptional regulator n=1 Tax=Nocardia fluminea TaxID=134984 RepID=UPI0036573724